MTAVKPLGRNPLKIRASLGLKAQAMVIAAVSQSLKDQGKSRTENKEELDGVIVAIP